MSESKDVKRESADPSRPAAWFFKAAWSLTVFVLCGFGFVLFVIGIRHEDEVVAATNLPVMGAALGIYFLALQIMPLIRSNELKERSDWSLALIQVAMSAATLGAFWTVWVARNQFPTLWTNQNSKDLDEAIRCMRNEREPDLDRAEVLLKKVLDRVVNPEATENLAICLCRKGDAHFRRGENAPALACYREATRLAERAISEQEELQRSKGVETSDVDFKSANARVLALRTLAACQLHHAVVTRRRNDYQAAVLTFDKANGVEYLHSPPSDMYKAEAEARMGVQDFRRAARLYLLALATVPTTLINPEGERTAIRGALNDCVRQAAAAGEVFEVPELDLLAL